jgi:MipA family protein
MDSRYARARRDLSRVTWGILGLFLAASAAEAADPGASWDLTLGAGAADIPKYPGSNSTKLEPLPVIRATYRRFFIGGDGGGGKGGIGINLYEDPHWRLAAVTSIGFIKPRMESDDPHLKGLGDINATPRAGMFASFKTDWLSVGLAADTDVGGNHEGTTATLEIMGRYKPTPRLTLSAGPGLLWTDARYAQTFFGIDASQSSRSGLPQYTARGGVNSISLSAGASYQVDAHWGLGLRVTAARLQGDAGNSPITEKRNQQTIGAFFAYHFGQH